MAKLSLLAASGFPWAPRPGEAARAVLLRRAGRRAILARWPAPLRALLGAWMTVAWPVAAFRSSLGHARVVLPWARAGRSTAALTLKAYRAALAHSFPPAEYFLYGLFLPGRPGAGQWLSTAETTALLASLTDPGGRALVADKLAFACACSASGVRMVETLAEIVPGAPVPPLPAEDVVTKPRFGSAGRGVTLGRFDGERHLAAGAAQRSTDAAARLAGQSALWGPLLVQRRLRAEPGLAAPGSEGVPVLRLVTARWPQGRAQACYATVQWPRPGSFGNVGGPLRLVDLDGGRILGPTDAQANPVLDVRDDGALPDDRPVDGLRGVTGAVLAAHASLPARLPVLAWDIALSDQGPQVLEANVGIDFFAYHALVGRPVTETPLGEILAAALR